MAEPRIARPREPTRAASQRRQAILARLRDIHARLAYPWHDGPSVAAALQEVIETMIEERTDG